MGDEAAQADANVDAILKDANGHVAGQEAKYGCTNSLFNGDFTQFALSMAHSAEEFARHIWLRGWQVVQFAQLPAWLKDNDFLIRGHRPALNSYWGCFKSVFRIHTETGNIWTHLLGCVLFAAIFTYFMIEAPHSIQWQDKLVIGAFFTGAVVCLGFSCLFHTLCCHSVKVARFANKLDYAGIAILTIGSFIPFLYYTFYCGKWQMIFYTALICVLGMAAILVSMIDKFATPRFRGLRAGVFIGLGLSGVIPAMHYTIVAGWESAVNDASLGWLILMAVLYIGGALLYAFRIPERLVPGCFDLWFQSHQIFHVLVVAAALVHYYGISQLADFRLTRGDCRPEQPLFIDYAEEL
ncbi:Adiponectin receptor protein 2 [Sparganum proliferum]